MEENAKGGLSSNPDNEEQHFAMFQELDSIDLATISRRETCEKCCRPMTVCWCPYLPKVPISVKTTLYILQHPFEESRCLRTAPMLYHGLEKGRCHVLRGKKFNTQRFPELAQVCNSPNTLVLYPGPNAVDISEVVVDPSVSYNLIAIDGTWRQAGGIFCHNKFLHNAKQVQLSDVGTSEYVIRTQPTEGCLSTVETCAIALAKLEGRPEIKEELVSPLRALCSFQLEHGAVKHHSKQFLVENGLYKKQMPRPQDDASKEFPIKGNKKS